MPVNVACVIKISIYSRTRCPLSIDTTRRMHRSTRTAPTGMPTNETQNCNAMQANQGDTLRRRLLKISQCVLFLYSKMPRVKQLLLYDRVV